jgi:protein PhnA
MLALLSKRSDGACELCAASNADASLTAYALPNSPDASINCTVLLCGLCRSQVESDGELDAQHLRCLNQSMWSSVPAVQVLSYRLLNRLKTESWAQDALEMLYLEDDIKSWAQAGLFDAKEPTFDANGVALAAGDSVTIIKDLDVKGANFTAKRGVAVRNIGLSENPLHIEGKVNGQRIVIIAAYTKKN